MAVDKAKYQFRSSLGKEVDAFLANAFVAAQATNCVFYHEQMGERLRNDLWKFIERNRQADNSRGKFEGNGFIPGHVIFGDQGRRHQFSFLDRIG